MKKLFYLSFIIPFLVFSQNERKYIVLDSLQSKYKIEKYTLNTKSLYKVDTEIEMYNIFGGGLILLSVLPNLQELEQTWKKVDFYQIQNEIFTQKEFHRFFVDLFFSPRKNKILLPTKEIYRYKLVKKENNQYFVSNYCLFEYFKEVNYPSPIRISGEDILNLKQDFISIVQMKQIWENQTENKHGFPMEPENVLLDYPILNNHYLSKIETKNDDKVYRFWFFTGWGVQDGYNDHRGIDRFAYIPSKGIVGGSYDFYFLFVPKYANENAIKIKLSPEQWKENREQEKIMWAKELFPEKQ